MEHLRSLLYECMLKINISENWAEKPPPPFLPFHQRPGPYCTCGIPMVPIIQIHTQIPPIQISSLGYQFCQLFKILTYREVQDTVSRYRWKPYMQPLTIHANIPAIPITLLDMAL